MIIRSADSGDLNCAETSEFPTKSLYGGLSVEAYGGCDCDCSSGTKTGTCNAGITFAQFEGSGCTGSPISSVGRPLEGSCSVLDAFSYESSYQIAPEPAELTCTGTVVANLAGMGLIDLVAGCTGAPVAGTCDDADMQCLPLPTGDYERRTCIYSTIETSCPSDYPQGSTVYRRTYDGRNCNDGAACTCGGEGNCQAGVQPNGDSSCTMPQVSAGASTDVPYCRNVAADAGTLSYRMFSLSYVEDSGTCETGSVEPEGAAEGADAVTVCCRDLD